MKFEEFKEYVREHLAESCPDVFKDVEFSIQNVTKNNGKTLTALSFTKDDCLVSPVFYLEHFYEKYEKGIGVKECMEEIAKLYKEFRVEPGNEPVFPETFDEARENIRLKLTNLAMNKEALAESPHFIFGDLAVSFLLEVTHDTIGTGTVTVTNNIAENWEVSAEELLKAGMENMKTKDKYRIFGVNALFSEAGFPDVLGEEEEGGPGMYVLSSESRILGAAGMMDLHLIGEFADKTGRDVYILPSSIHELILVPDFGHVSLTELQEMVHSVNSTVVAKEEILSENVYVFRRESGRIYKGCGKSPLVLKKAGIKQCS